jgi:hypothetical protein
MLLLTIVILFSTAWITWNLKELVRVLDEIKNKM